jgi:hypothetical protein
MSQWDDFLTTIVDGVKAAATGDIANFLTEATADAKAFVAAAQSDLQTWTSQLAQGGIDADDFADNVKGEAALAKLAALTEAGIAAEALQTFRDQLLNIVVGAAEKVFLP